MDDFILRIGKNTNHVKAGKAIVTNVINNKKIFIDVMGAAANYIAVKSFVEACRLMEREDHISFVPFYKDLEINHGEIKTVVRWLVLVN